ncbi:hypothetical protein ACFXPX_14150 [Kitasatospora sp. NPDC059146]|uniref:hypothetical protein n=1 Tax=Kitasatospora sp. NPDC059146 TaxID=3346741 RepID=UPI0036C573F5
MKSIGKAGLAIGSALLLAACSGGGGGGGAAAAPSASPSAAATPFGTALDQALAPVGVDFGKATSAKSAFDLDTALTRLASDANRAARNVNAATVPSGATAARADLATALTTLATDTEPVGKDISEHRVCSVGGGLAQFGAGQGVAGVSAALAKLAAAGYRTAFAVPELPKPQTQARSLDNGTVVQEGGKGGKGVVKVDNTGQTDAVFTIAANGTSVASVYAAKGQQATIEGIADGVYDFYFSTGLDWDSGAKQFTQGCAFARFTGTHDFTPDRGGTIWTLTVLAPDGKERRDIEWLRSDPLAQP